MHPPIQTELLQWDSQFFGFGVARIHAVPADDESLGVALASLKAEGIRLAYWQTDPEDAASNRAAAQHGGVLVNMRAELSAAVIVEGNDPDVEIIGTDAAEDDHARLHELALQSGEQSRFRLDQRIPEQSWATLYRLWMDASLAGEQADAVLVRRRQGRISGMITVSATGTEGEIGLFGVAAEARGQGVGSALLDDAMHWFAAKGCAVARVATQGENAIARRVYERAGFRLERLVNVFHFWI